MRRRRVPKSLRLCCLSGFSFGALANPNQHAFCASVLRFRCSLLLWPTLYVRHTLSLSTCHTRVYREIRQTEGTSINLCDASHQRSFRGGHRPPVQRGRHHSGQWSCVNYLPGSFSARLHRWAMPTSKRTIGGIHRST